MVAGVVSPPYHAPAPIQQWLCRDTVTELRGLGRVRQIAARPRPAGVALTWLDGLAGAGGSSSGIFMVAGNAVTMAINHWPLAVETHNYNMPDVDHDVANVARVDPRRYPRTDCAWFSPECTYWSMSRGEKCDYDKDFEQPTLGLFPEEEESPAAREARWRSRLLMTDVIRFARQHKYRAIIVENVPDILKWSSFDRFLKDMHVEGYRHKVITLNSAFAQGLGAPAPQLRDRVYIVFWLACYPTPNWDKWLRPKAWCPTCGEVVSAIYTPKPGRRRPMRYGAQYFYRCPKKACERAPVQPYVLPAAAAIDWSLDPGPRIGDRKKPLAAKTRARIEAGLRRYARPITAEVAGHTFERRPGVRTWPVDRPLTVQNATASKAIACPPLLAPTGGCRRDDASPVDRPMWTRTTTENDSLVVPPFLTVLRSDRARTIDLDHPLATVVADGSNHAMVVPLEGRDGIRARSVGEPLSVQTTRHEDALVVPYYGRACAKPTSIPLDTVMTRDHHALVVPVRNNGVARPAGQYPTPTFAAGGEHVAVVMRNNTARGDQGQMCTPVDEPARTLLANGPVPSLVRWDHLLYQYDSGDLRPLVEPMPTQTTVDGDAPIGRQIEVDDCTLRMLALHEIQEGMAFHPEFVLLGKAKRDNVRMLGNAVTPCAARDLAACVTEAVTGVDIDPFEFDVRGLW